MITTDAVAPDSKPSLGVKVTVYTPAGVALSQERSPVVPLKVAPVGRPVAEKLTVSPSASLPVTRNETAPPVVTVTGLGGATVGNALERKEATADAAKPSSSIAVKRKLSAPPGEGAVKVVCSAVSLASVTAGPLNCCQR